MPGMPCQGEFFLNFSGMHVYFFSQLSNRLLHAKCAASISCNCLLGLENSWEKHPKVL